LERIFKAVGTVCSIAVLGLVPCAAQSVQVYETYGDQSKLLERRSADLAFAPPSGAQPDSTITIDETSRFQTMDGFGASLTDSSSWLIANKLDLAARRALFRSLFDPAYGAGISLLRQPMGASDFSSRGNFSYADQPDPNLTQFSIAPYLEFTTPLLREAIAANPSLRLLALPWSPPGWMKFGGVMNGGVIQTDQFSALALYFVKFLQAYQREGLPVYAVSMQNEPLYSTQLYPTAYVAAPDQAAFIGKFLGPALQQAGFDATRILAYDHNWDHPEYPISVLDDPDANQYAAGAAFHCYGGDVSAQSTFKAAHSDKDVWFTECSGTVGSSFAGDLAWNARTLLIGATRNWARSVILWNIALDQNSGPKNGGCSNCRGVVTIDTSASPPTVTRNVEYYVLGHLAKFVRPGAIRIGSEPPGTGPILHVAFQNPDGSLVLFVLNNGSPAGQFTVAWNGQAFAHSLPVGAVATFVWNTRQPSFPPNGVVSAAHPLPSLSPGALFSIYGTELADEIGSVPFFPLAATMGGASVSISGKPAPLLYVSPGQINAQMPWETGAGDATVSVTRAGVSVSQPVHVSAVGPAIFTLADGLRAAAVNFTDGSANSAANPVAPGSFVILFATGLGAVSPPVASGEPALADPLSHVAGTVTVELGGRPVIPDYAGLAPSFAGLWQLNVLVPPETASGAVSVVIVLNGVRSNAATIAVR
jgi:glucosylceramidase